MQKQHKKWVASKIKSLKSSECIQVGEAFHFVIGICVAQYCTFIVIHQNPLVVQVLQQNEIMARDEAHDGNEFEMFVVVGSE